jgi:hypothetical protein
MRRQILQITTNLGYWGEIKKHDNVVININSSISSFDKESVIPLSTDEYIPRKGDKVYFLPGVNVPRVKFKEIALEYGIRTVRNPNEADVFFGNKSTTDKITTHSWNYKIETKHLRDALDNNTLDVDHIYIEKLQTALEFYTDEFIMVDHPLAMELVGEKSIPNSQTRLLTISEDFIQLGEALVGKVIFEESTIVDRLNGQDASVIDAAMFNQLATMFQSTDADNHILAMEIIANCKYSASLAHMLLLFKDFSPQMYSSHTRNHVNFKSLVSWLGGRILTSNTLDDLCDILKDKGQFNPENLNILLNHSHKDILDRGDSRYFRIKVITLEEEELINLNTNYTYDTVEDFIPVEVEEEVSDEDIAAAFTMMERNELKSELIELEEDLAKGHSEESKGHEISEEVITEEVIETSLETEPVSNNNQITQTNEHNDIDWF